MSVKRAKQWPIVIANVHILRDPSLSTQAKLLYVMLCTYADNSTREAWMSAQRLVDAGISETTRKRAQRELVERGLLEVQPRHDVNGRRRTNRWILHDVFVDGPEGGVHIGPPQEGATSDEGGGQNTGGRGVQAGPLKRGSRLDPLELEEGTSARACDHGRRTNCPYCPGGRLAHLEERRA